MSQACPNARISIADYKNSDIEIYPAAPSNSLQPCGIITQGVLEPSGIAVGNDGTVYVSDFAVNAKTVFPKNATSPSRTIFTAAAPEYAFVGADGTLSVSEAPANQIEVFAPGAGSPKLTIPVTLPWGVATDKKNTYT